MLSQLDDLGRKESVMNKYQLVYCAFICAIACILKTTEAQATNYGLMVGIDHYSPSYGASSLNSCVNDANGFGSGLKTDSSRWPSSNIATLTDSTATESNIKTYLTTFAADASSGDTMVYFHSSHGGTYGGYNAFLCTYNSDFTDTELADTLDSFASGVNVIIILDACYSGGMFKEKDGAQVNLSYHFATNVMTKLSALRREKGRSEKSGANIAWMTACNYNETCSAGIPYSVFAGYLIEGFSYADANNNSIITFKELFDYAEPKATDDNPDQNAQSYNNSVLENTTAISTVGTTTTSTTGGGIIITTTTLPPERAEANDYSGDGCADMAVFFNSVGYWFVATASNEVSVWALEWGWEGSTPVSGDFNGDNQCDPAIFVSTSGCWYVCTIDGEEIAYGVSSGTAGDIPVSGDYNGDNIDDFGVFDSGSGQWDVVNADGDTLIGAFCWGWPGAVPVSGDYDGDGKSDLAVFDDQNGYWYILTTSGTLAAWELQWGWNGAIPVPGDYDGDGKSDLAVFDNQNGYWFVRSIDGSLIAWYLQWGWAGADAVCGDFNGDGRSDYAVYDSASGYWFIMSSADNSIIVWGTQWGGAGATAVSR